MTDSRLVKEFLKGDKRAFETLVSRYQRPLFYQIRSLVLDTEEARDLTQKAFLIAYRRLTGLKDPDRFKGWLFKIGTNLAMEQLRKAKPNKMSLDQSICIQARGQDPEDQVICQDLGYQVRQAIEKLSPRQRAVLGLRAFQDLSFKSISQLLGIKEETARSNYHFALKSLRKLLEKRGMGHEV